MFTIRSPKTLLHQHDFHAILIVVLIDLGLTITGIMGGQGQEANPLYAPLTHSFSLMITGVIVYIGILAVFSLVLTGATRKVFASLAFGMHVSGVLTWFPLLGIAPVISQHFNVFYYTLAAAGATAVFYFTEDLHETTKNPADSLHPDPQPS